MSGSKTRESNKMYASSISYAPQGAVSSMALGNGLAETTSFNNRLQPTQISMGSSASFVYGYGTTNNNGNMITQQIIAPGLNVTQTYSYLDPMNRLTGVSEDAGWNQTYAYDRYGNRNGGSSSSPYLPVQTPTISESNNRITAASYSYDNAGNLTQWPTAPGNSVYDAENKMVSFNSGAGTYSYDGDGRRVKKIVGTTTSIFVYNAPGQLVAEYTTPAPVATGGTSYLMADHLGSTRVVTNASGTVSARHDYLPFGEEIPSGIGGRTTGMGYGANEGLRHKFTAKERDAETGNDDFGARHYSSSLGRFMQPDPSPMGVAIADPQSWNLYSYVRNRPTRSVDVGGNWATDVHAQIVTYALQGYVSAGELDELRARQYVMDSDQSNQIKHAMANHGQSSQDALTAMWQFVSNEMTIASENNSGGTLNKTGLDALGDAIHTVEDFTSPEHTDTNFMPLEWKGGFWPPWKMVPGAAHVLGEGSPAAGWSRIGYAIRLTMAAYLQSGARCEAGKRCLTEANFESEVRRNIEDYVHSHYNYVTLAPGSNAIQEDAARQCALGNPAACDR